MIKIVCLIQYLFWEATKKIMPCKGEECRWYGGATCYAWRKAMIIHNSELDISLGVFHLNSHKKPILGVKSGNKIVKYASFDNDLKAEYFMEILINFFGVRQEVER